MYVFFTISSRWPRIRHIPCYLQVAKLWRDAPENPNRGKTNEKSKPVEDKENAQKKPRGKKSSPVVVEEDAENKEEEEADEAEDK